MLNRISPPRAALATLAWAAGAYPQEPLAHQKLIPTLWVQTSEEWRGACRQAFEQARLNLDRARKDKRSSAAIEQDSDFRKLPPAVILDVDETVLDNSPAQARQVLEGAGFTLPAWNRWVEERSAAAIPGAVEFCRYAASRRVRLFFVTNRDHAQEAATRDNLARLGFPLEAGEDTVLCRGEKAEWNTSDKGTRRKEVAARYRILLLIGDDLGDFLSGARSTLERRSQLTAPYVSWWGRHWIVLPNPGYGSWEEALFGETRPANPGARMERKIRLLRAQ